MAKHSVDDKFEYLLGRISALESICWITLASHTDSIGDSSKTLTRLEELRLRARRIRGNKALRKGFSDCVRDMHERFVKIFSEA